MRRGLAIVLLALLLGVAGYALVRWQHHQAEHVYGHDYAQHGADGHHPELEWLRRELQVTEAQMAEVRALHVAYHPVCEQLTHRLESSHRSLTGLIGTATGVSPEVEAALKEHVAVHLECERAMLKHFYETAACLSREQARRYLDRMLPFVFMHDSSGSSGHTH